MTVIVQGGPFVCSRASGLYQEVRLFDSAGNVIALGSSIAYLEIRDFPQDGDPLLRLSSDEDSTAGGSQISIPDPTDNLIIVSIGEDDARDEDIFPLLSRVIRYRKLIETEIVVRGNDGIDLLGSPIPFPFVFIDTMTRP